MLCSGRHHKARQKQSAAGLTALPVLLQMVGVGQFFQRVCGTGMAVVNVRDLMVCVPVNPGVEKGDDHIASRNPGYHQKYVGIHFLRIQSLGQQIKAHNGGHHSRRERQQKADGFAGILTKQAGDKAAHTCAAHTGQGCNADYTP